MLIVYMKNTDATIECERFEEKEHGLVLYQSAQDYDSQENIVGYVPYRELAYVEVEGQADDLSLP